MIDGEIARTRVSGDGLANLGLDAVAVRVTFVHMTYEQVCATSNQRDTETFDEKEDTS